MTQVTLEAATPFIAWSRIWNLSLGPEPVSQAWRSLNLPDSFEHWSGAFAACFGRAVALDITAPCSGAEQHLAAVCDALELSWDGVALPREHLAAVCELLAYAIERNEPALAASIGRELLIPWCEYAEQQLVGEQGALKFLIDDFAQDVLVTLQ